MNINCSTCLESFTSGCDISTTPCGHVFHTGCITRWLNQNDNCSQCREACGKRQIIKLYFSECQSAIEENITINDLQQKSLKLEEQSQTFERELTVTKTQCKQLEHEKLLMKLDWSKTEWSLKKSINEANKQIKDLEKNVEDVIWMAKKIQAQAEKEKTQEISEPQQGTFEYEKMLLAYGFPPFPYPIPSGVDPSMHMHMLTTDPVYKAKYDKDRLDKEKAFKEQIDRDNREKDRKAGVKLGMPGTSPGGPNPYNFQPFGLPTNVSLPTVPVSPQQAAAMSAATAAAAAAQAAKEKRDMNSGTQQGTNEYEKMLLAYGFPPYPYPIPPGVDPSMHMHMLTTDPVYKAKYDKDRLENEKVFKEQIDRDKRDRTLLDSDDSD